MRRKSKTDAKYYDSRWCGRIEGEPLEPMRTVVRELTRPDGTTLIALVPVYPPFKLKQRPPEKAKRARPVRKAG